MICRDIDMSGWSRIGLIGETVMVPYSHLLRREYERKMDILRKECAALREEADENAERAECAEVAFAELRDAVEANRAALKSPQPGDIVESWGEVAKRRVDTYDRVTAALKSLPSDLVTERDRRLQAEGRSTSPDAIDTLPWGTIVSDATDPNYGRSCICGLPVRAGRAYAHRCAPENRGGR